MLSSFGPFSAHHTDTRKITIGFYWAHLKYVLFLFSFRWTKLRSAMCPHTIFLEPLSECMLLGCLSAWAVNFLFRWDPISFFLIHVLLWFIMDWTLLHIVQVIIHTTCPVCCSLGYVAQQGSKYWTPRARKHLNRATLTGIWILDIWKLDNLVVIKV